MRFISIDESKLSLKEIESGLKQYDSNYQIEGAENNDSEGTLIYADGVYGQLEVNEKGDAVFEEDIETLRADVENAEGENKQKVLAALENAMSLLFVRVIYQGRSDEATFEKIDPIWDLLLKNRNGLMHADYEGYYDASGLIFEV